MIGTETKERKQVKEVLRQNMSFMAPFLFFVMAGGLLQVLSTKREIFLFVNRHYHEYADWFFSYFTHVGDGLFCVLVILALLFIRYGYALTAALAFGVSALTSVVLKRLVFADAYRPRKFFESEPDLLRFIEGVKVHTANSFPSGHTVTAFAILSVVAFMVKDKRWGVVIFCAALLAAFSRMYLAQHFFEDIYWGSIIGVSSTVFVWHSVMNRSQLSSKSWWDKSLLNR
jgi:membrane-associated phospholipid phosphatase